MTEPADKNPDAKVPFAPAQKKLTIASLDEPKNPKLTIQAQYNPKELQIDRTIPWAKPPATNKTGNAKAPGEIRLEFTGAEGRSLQIELLFDGYETKGGDVATKIEGLETLASVRSADGSKSTERRPHHCVVSWGDKGLPKFRCVIESLSIKYQMFSDLGQPLRATATVKLKEADAVQLAKKT